MNNFNIKLSKTFFYNLIIFDFILLSASKKTISNFFLETYLFTKKKKILRISTFELLKSFKVFVRLFQFIAFQAKNKKFIRQIFISIWCGNVQNLKFLNFFFKKYKLSLPLEVSNLFLFSKPKNLYYKNVLILNQKLKRNDYKNFFFSNHYLLQQVNTFEEINSWGSYKIFNNLNDFKKLIFIGLMLVQIFKK